MLVLIDVGNTNIVVAMYENEKKIGEFRIVTDATDNVEELNWELSKGLTAQKIHGGDVEDVVICSVVPGIMDALEAAVETSLGKKCLVIDREIDPGLPYISGEGKERLGADRAVASVAAMEKYGKPILVWDFGTATTLDSVNENGVYAGGCIMAGLKTSIHALFSKAAMLPEVELAVPEKVLNLTAVGHIQAGTVGGYIGSVEYLTKKAKKELGDDSIKVVATGGLARYIADNTDSIDYVDPDLIPLGMLYLYKKYIASSEK